MTWPARALAIIRLRFLTVTVICDALTVICDALQSEPVQLFAITEPNTQLGQIDGGT